MHLSYWRSSVGRITSHLKFHTVEACIAWPYVFVAESSWFLAQKYHRANRSYWVEYFLKIQFLVLDSKHHRILKALPYSLSMYGMVLNLWLMTDEVIKNTM